MKPGRELDALIAQHVMGWIGVNAENGTGYPPTANLNPYQEGLDFQAYERARNSYDFIPEYSTDISAAWEVVEKLKVLTEHNGKLFSSRDPWLSFARILSSYDSSFGETLWHMNPKEICLAALKAVGEKV